jgi:uncharacterized protein
MLMEQLTDPAIFGPPLIGGGLIGLGAAMMAVLNGRVTGISGIVSGLLQRNDDGAGWRAAFVVGLIAAPLLYALFDSAAFVVGELPSPPVLIFAGFLVGAGAGIGSGCTSGHGVCGLARGSVRSLAATVTFMVAAAVTVFVVRHVIGG